ncbi:hypothetical protein OC842_001860 [Tilletia horrida]|uniref:Spindle pole body component n=1 Tax=Tilletia horrida TaxID=155126 RepID=A0AAN6GEU1_9BASI|nr:hypothetical protein OC842_001860 [Tilletia horrida]
MIAEALAALAGHGALAPPPADAAAIPSTGETAVVEHLHRLAARYVRVKRFATTQLEHARLHTLRAHQQQHQAQSSRAAGKRKEPQLQLQPGGTGSTTSHLVPLCQTILAVLREYEQLVLEAEHKLIYSDPALVAARKTVGSAGLHTQEFVSLAALRSVFEVWERPLACLEELVDQLIRGPPEGSVDGGIRKEPPELSGGASGASGAVENQDTSKGTPGGGEPSSDGRQPAITTSSSKLVASARWTGGQLIDMLVIRSTSSVGPVQRIMQALLSAVEVSFMRRLQVWLCRGDISLGGGSSAQRFAANDVDRLVEMAHSLEMQDGDGDEGAGHKPFALHPALAGLAQHLSPGLKAMHTKQHGLTFLERRWRFREDALPDSVSEDTAQDMLTVGRVLSAVRASSRTAAFTSLGARATATRGARAEFDAAILSPELYQAHTALLQQADVRPSHSIEFAEAMRQIREDVCEWLWQNVLTIGTVTSALQALGDYSLQRNGSFALAFQSEINKTRRSKLLSAKSAAGAALQVPDLDLAFHRASLSSHAEDDPALERFHFTMPGVKVRQSMPLIMLGAGADLSRSRRGGGAAGERSLWSQSRVLDKLNEPARFDDLLLGVPVQLHYTVAFPLDLFLSPMDLAAYSRLFSFLAAMRRTQSRVLECWTTLSQSQRMRRRFTGTGEGGIDKKEENARKTLLRKGWGLTRKMSWFLDTLMGHFQTDIIEVQYTRLIAQLQSTQVDADEQGDDNDEARTVSAGATMRPRHGSSSRRTSAAPSRRRVSSTPSRPQRDRDRERSSNEAMPPHPLLPQDDMTSAAASGSGPLAATPTIVHSPSLDHLPSSESSSRLAWRANSRRRAPAAGSAGTSSAHTVVRRSSGLSIGSNSGSGSGSGLNPGRAAVAAAAAGSWNVTSSSAAPSRASTVIVGGSGAKGRGVGSGGGGLGVFNFPSSPSVVGKGGVLSAVGTGAGASLAGGSGAGAGSGGAGLDALQRSHLDFNSLQATHSAFLAFVQDGLLLSSPAASALLRAILELCDQFVGAVERWGGDVVPDLLSEGNLTDKSSSGGGGASELVNKMAIRQRVVQQVETELDDLLADFFRLLSGVGSPQGQAGGASDGSGAEGGAGDASKMDASVFRGNQSVGSLSLLGSQVPLARADQSRSRAAGSSPQGPHHLTGGHNNNRRAGDASQAQIRANEARLEADVAARRHLEQLLLRLDFNHHFTDQIATEEQQQDHQSLGLPRSGSGATQQATEDGSKNLL